MTLNFQKLMAIFRKFKVQSILLMCHQNADPDALCSAYALSCLLQKIDPSFTIKIAAFQGLNKLSKQILKYLPIPVGDTLEIKQADVVILIDTNTVEQLGSWKDPIEQSMKPLIVIDHHAIHPHSQPLTIFSIIDEEAFSTCTIIYTLYQQAQIRPNKREALALFLGLLYDTKHFKLATLRTFRIIVDLVQIGVNVTQARQILSTSMELPERIARVKAAKRLRLIQLGEWLLVFSSVHSYHASVARALLSLGAHMVIVGGKRKKSLVISMRTSQVFFEKTGLHLGRDIAQPLGIFLKGRGGGHATAAGVNGEGELEDAFQECIRLVNKKLTL
jgi:nanoRNase/pAp phosphatase (c-di-AMP/oligoRNAs hydrolase)